MNPLLEQFLAESREGLQGIGEKLMHLEREPGDVELMTALFRLVHTLKGNSGLFEFHELIRVLHAAEDLMDAVRRGDVPFSQLLADRLLDAMDFVAMLCDEIEMHGEIGGGHAAGSARFAESLRQLLAQASADARSSDVEDATPPDVPSVTALGLSELPTQVLADYRQRLARGEVLKWIEYTPVEECFFQGDDPFHLARLTPGMLWGRIVAREPWPAITELDAYRCVLSFTVLSNASRSEVEEHFRYVPDQVRIVRHDASILDMDASGVLATESDETRAERHALRALIAVQRHILTLPAESRGHTGRIKAVAKALEGCLLSSRGTDPTTAAAYEELSRAVDESIRHHISTPLLLWLDRMTSERDLLPINQSASSVSETAAAVELTALEADVPSKVARRAEDATSAKSLKVDQAKVDRLMNLIGEMVVSKNALPYLAGRAESVYGSRDMAREIKAQYAVINRIVEEMQDAIMQVRMMPVSFVFQRFPRLVRDISRKLGKDVQLVLEGEETEADKNIIEALSDPLIHIVRNSLDHGLEMPDVRRAAGKPVTGTLTIRAMQESDRVIIEIVDDGKGIDPAVVKRKAYEKGLIDETSLERVSDQEAVNLIFAPGFSTMDVVSDLSGRGVGMDVVRTAIEQVHGTVVLESEVGKGTRIRLSLPLSMAVTNVMIVESDGKKFGVPMDSVVETVRVPRSATHTIKQSLATVLRGKLVPLKSVNSMLALSAPPMTNAQDELAVLVVRLGDAPVGLLVDDFRGTADIILKPMSGVLAGLTGYVGSALMGDGSVLMVLNVKELL